MAGGEDMSVLTKLPRVWSYAELCEFVGSPAGRPEYYVLGPVDVDLHPSYRAPDLVAVAVEAAERAQRPLPATDVSLALEIVSPGSVTDDRVVKPAQYAAHGIATFVRVEIHPQVTVTVHELTDGIYVETGTWGPGEIARLTRPFTVEIPVDAITP